MLCVRFAFVGALACVAALAGAQVRTWTTTADFGTGTFFNTNATAVAGELRLNPQGSAPTAFLNVPVGGGRLVDRGWPNTPGRIMRIDTRTLRVVGEYRLTPESLVSMPSRAVVDSLGNVWATNAYDGGTVAVTKIGVIIGGTRHVKLAPGVYLPDSNGEYVKDPTFTTGVDRDGDGYIRTSVGLGNLLRWQATTGGDLDASIPADAPGTVSGTVGLQAWQNAEAAPPVDFELIPTAGGASVDVPGIELGLLGAFSFTTDLRGDFFLTCKGRNWLRQRLVAPIRITDSGATGQAFSLVNGDCVPDHAVNIDDFLLLASVYETTPTPGTPEALADLDGNGLIDIDDFLILAASYELVGD